MSRVIQFNAIEEAVRHRAGIGTAGEERLIMLVAVQAYLDMVWYKDHLQRTITRKAPHPVAPEIERQYRYSLVFFLHPWGRSGRSYAAYLFSLIGKERLIRRIQKAVRNLEGEIRALEGRHLERQRMTTSGMPGTA